MASLPIEISSSDSDLEVGDDLEIGRSHVRDSTNFRVLPSTLISISRSTGYGGQSQKVPSTKRAYASGGSSSNLHNHSQAKVPMNLGSGGDIIASNRSISLTDDSKYYTGNGNLDRPGTVNYQIANGSVRDYEKLSSKQALKRTLPSSLEPYATSSKSNNSVDNVSGTFRDTRGNSYHSAGTSLANSKGYMRDQYSRGYNNEAMMYESNGSRILPPSIVHGKSISSMQFSGSNDPLYRAGLGEERVAENDERLIYQAALEDMNQPKVEASLPDGLLSVSLLRHQKIALAWMLQKENRFHPCLGGILADDQGLGKTISMIALIQMQKSSQLESKSDEICDKKTEALNLDDDDDNGGTGLGKVNKAEVDEIKVIPEASTSTRAFSRRRPLAGTLIVCPASILRQWARELDDKIPDESKLSVVIYHGGNRTKDPVELAKYDVVLTTYSIVANEVPKQPLVDEDEADEKNGDKYGLSMDFSSNKKRKKSFNGSKKGKKGRKGIDSSSIDCGSGPLARVLWCRVILDEAQTIKNHRTQVARACCSLKARTRWCLSGTPIQNAVDDLYSYFRFLKYEPYAVYKTFCNTIKFPISKNTVTGYKKLQAVLRAIMLRRTKGTFIDGEAIINLPPKSVCLSKVDFSTEERAFYTKLEADSRSQFKAYAAAGTLSQNYANILLMLLRLRQACDHPVLVKGFNADSVRNDSVELAKGLPKDILVDLLDRLDDSFAICRVCNDPPEDPVVTTCGHVFCYQCVSEYLTGDDNMCPASGCKEQLVADAAFSKSTLIRCISDDTDGNPMHSQDSGKSILLQNEYSSSKIRAVLEILQSHCRSNRRLELQGSTGCNGTSEGPIKTILFSQWTSMLDLVELSLNQYCIQYRRLDGTMSLVSRDKAVKDFSTDSEITVMLMSLKAGNLGLNMVAACHVILLDLWWNPTTEDQAVDRAHRIGQTRSVTVTRVTIKDTVEDRILALQEEKRKMVASAFGEDHTGGTATRLTVEDLKYLFRFDGL
ncbi:SNF2_N domain-containing protein/Helicase_C domain-containing protein/zf-C3HC4_2 domain-containing protein [Cephalotus follicularis]|uniref:SNF2_N domain-containing protein/Helicase_C domain-containing protein/zf-C3HC4_2 domain-containing protein n=1 Tax=Cephalotus follicularis TaxID=3775 RepID=A0A1Q3B2Z9_CEPFO|nr:SNF2_N domain-containing protein/Helicase_C domain-containing protein/zf-C3HC4_2 domain-containing protein [Cephalotus follicularis]